MKVRKAVIIAAGWGTRFLPASRTVPKEMLPLVDKPLIHYGVEEAMLSGIEQIIIVTARGKQPWKTTLISAWNWNISWNRRERAKNSAG